MASHIRFISMLAHVEATRCAAFGSIFVLWPTDS